MTLSPDDKKELSKLSPQKRIEKLKELEEGKLAEIKEAQKLIKENETQIAIEDRLSDIQVPSVEEVDVKGLFKSSEDLEKTVAKEQPSIPEELIREQQEYIRQLPGNIIEQRTAYIESQFDQSGYATQEQQAQVAAIYHEARSLMDNPDGMGYATSKHIEHTLSVTKKLLSEMYKS